MTNGELPQCDLEVFQRWALRVDDQLGDAVDAMMALEQPDSEPLNEEINLLQTQRSSADLASDVIAELKAFREDPDRPAWFTPAFQMVLVVSTRAELLMDYVNEVTSHGLAQVNAAQRDLIIETIYPAIAHFDRFLAAVKAAEHLN